MNPNMMRHTGDVNGYCSGFSCGLSGGWTDPQRTLGKTAAAVHMSLAGGPASFLIPGCRFQTGPDGNRTGW